ncbi:MAG: AEC family transporter [Oscillospiraceae bacterium]|nr:AEC family transporter [Oscillospiraceae bacterium]
MAEMLKVFNLTLNNVGMLLIFISVGYILRRSHKLPDEAGKVMSLLCVMVFSPAYSILNLSKNVRIDKMAENLQLLGYGLGFAVVAVVTGLILGKAMGKSPMDKSSLTYAFTFPNYGYFGYPVIEGVFGKEGLGDFMVFAIPMSILCCSYGYVLFQKDKKINLLRLLKTPVIAAMFIGIALGLSGIALPENNILYKTLDGAGKCMSPCSMLLAGFMLGKFPLKKLFSGIRPYYLTAIRMLGIPVAFGAVMYLCGLRGNLLFWPLVFACLPLGLNLVVYAESSGFEKEAGDNAKLCFISYVLALVVLPCLFAVMTRIAGM